MSFLKQILARLFQPEIEKSIQAAVDQYVIENRIEELIPYLVQSYVEQYIQDEKFEELILRTTLTACRVWGNPARIKLAETAVINNALLNVESGNITIGEHAFFGHNISLLTGSHDYQKFGIHRRQSIPLTGNDIVIEEGVWLASNVTVIGPSHIGKHAVVAAGSLVKGTVPAYSVVAGLPAKVIKTIDHPEN